MKLGGAREAIHDATAIHLLNRSDLNVLALGTRVDKSTAGSANSLIVDAVEAGRILSVVYKQPPAVRDWLLYAYGAVPNKVQRATLAHDLYRREFARNEPKHALKRSRMLCLCGAAIDDMKMRVNNGRKLPTAYMSAVVGCHEDSFRRNYVRPLKEVQRVIQQFDRAGLSEVFGVLLVLRGFAQPVKNAANN